MISTPLSTASWSLEESPLISVIVPSYNHQDYIYACLNSIINQSYDNIELVFIDDFSADKTFEIAADFLNSSSKPRFKRVDISRNVTNLGAHETINLGVSRARGAIIAVINSDDEYHPERLSVIINEMKRKRSSLGFSLVEVENNSCALHSDRDLLPFIHFTVKQILDIQRDATVGFGLLRKNLAISTGNIIFTKDLYDKIGRFLPLKYCHDWDFVLQSLFYCEPAVVLQPLYKYRLHSENSFKGLTHLAEVETEAVLRRFFRRVVNAEAVNPLCPSPSNWPGYFEQFVARVGYSQFLSRELGNGLRSWRIYERSARQSI